MSEQTPLDLYYAGKLQDAITASLERVKQHPTDQSARGFLCELACFAGDLDRADRQLETLGHQDPESAVGYALFRQLIRAEQDRQQVFTEGRVPELLEPPSPRLRLHLEALIHLRDGQAQEAARLLNEAVEQGKGQVLKGTVNGKPFEGLRDLDDRSACFFEVLSTNGKYHWIPMERIESLEFRPHRRPRDLLWRRVQMVVRDGPEGEVYFPTLYPGAHAEADDRLRLGRLTEWRGGEGTSILGVGQRIFLFGEEDLPIMELEKLTIESP